MRILIYGSGGVGGYFGIRLAQVGNDVTFIARGSHLDSIKKNGFKLISVEGDYNLTTVKATDDLASLSSDFDLVLIGVKSWQILEAAKDIQSILSEKTLVIPLQNGIDQADKLLSILEKKHVLNGVCRIYSKVKKAGTIEHFAFPAEILFGELNNIKSKRVLKIKSVFDEANFKTTIPVDIQEEIWKKFLFICTVSGLGALTRVSIGKMYENKGTRLLLRRTAEEIFAIALAKGINLPENTVTTIMKFIENQPYESTASTQRDIMSGRPSELDTFNGYVVEQGKKFNIRTEVNEFIYNCLKLQEVQSRNL